MRIPKIIPDIVNRITGRWSPPATGPSKGKPRLHLDYVDEQKKAEQEETLVAAGKAAEEFADEQAKKRKYRKGGKTGGLESSMVPDAEFSSYYGRPIVKAPPWGWPIGVYLFLGGIAGGSSLIALGAQVTGNKELLRTTRLSSFVTAAGGSLALVGDLGRPERALNMFRVFKVNSPMSMGSWLLLSFASVSAIQAASEVDELLIEKKKYTLPLGGVLRRVLRGASAAGATVTGALGPLLASYTGVLFADTSNPAWNGAKNHLPYVFVSSGSLAAGGLALVTTSPENAGPARAFAVGGTAAELVAMKAMKDDMDPTIREVYEKDAPGKLLNLSEVCVIAGAVGAVLGRKNRVVSALSGLSLLTGSALTRFGILHAGHNSVKDPKYVVEPQKRRMEKDRAEGVVTENITTLS